MKSAIKYIFWFGIFAAGAGLLFVGYLGLLPGVVKLFGSDIRRDLGVGYTQADYERQLAKTGIISSDLASNTPPGSSLQFSGENKISESFTQEELTAALNNERWRYLPVKDVQIKISKNGTLELSGILLTERLDGFALVYGYENSPLKKMFDFVNILKLDPPFYLKGAISFSDNRINVHAQTIEIGRFAVPNAQLKARTAEIEEFADRIVASVPGLYAEKVTFSAGEMHFVGTLPRHKASVNE